MDTVRELADYAAPTVGIMQDAADEFAEAEDGLEAVQQGVEQALPSALAIPSEPTSSTRQPVVAQANGHSGSLLPQSTAAATAAVGNFVAQAKETVSSGITEAGTPKHTGEKVSSASTFPVPAVPAASASQSSPLRAPALEATAAPALSPAPSNRTATAPAQKTVTFQEIVEAAPGPGEPAATPAQTPAAPSTSTSSAAHSSAAPAAAAATPSATAAATTASSDLKEQLKDLPKVAADAAKQAGMAYVEAGKEVKGTLQQLLASLKDKDGPPITLTVDQIATALFFVVAAIPLLLLPIFMPSSFRLAYCVVWGLLFGLGLSFMFFYNRKKKAESNELLGINLGLKGLQLAIGGLPSVFAISDSEKMEWLNRLVVKVWPFVDKAVCNMIKSEVEKAMPGILKGLPPVLNGIVVNIGFQHLTFGGAPFRVEGIWVDPDSKDGLVMDLSVKWCGDPNITLAIQLAAGTVCPRIMDISFVGTIRVKLHPLVDRIPGFVGAMATMPKPPLIKYRLDFGKAMGGGALPALVTPVIDYFMKDIINNMLVWPQRLVVPILQETPEDKVAVQVLMRRHHGLLRVCVVRAKDLKHQDWGGTNDISIECVTDPENTEPTSVKRALAVVGANSKVSAGDTVYWHEYLYLLIQEPKSQAMRLQAMDYSKPGKANLTAKKSVIGRALVKLSDVTKAGLAGKLDEVTATVLLGENDWGFPGGPGKGAGKVRLNMRYYPFSTMTQQEVTSSDEGIITVRLMKVRGLTPAGGSLIGITGVTTTAEKNAKEASKKANTQLWTATRWENNLKNRIKALETALVNGTGHDDEGHHGVIAGEPEEEAKKRESTNGAQEAEGEAKKRESGTGAKEGAVAVGGDNKEAEKKKKKEANTYEAKRKAELQRKAAELVRLKKELAGGPVVELDYTLDASNLHALYHVTEKTTSKEGSVVDNCVIFTVKDHKKQLLAKASIPVREIKESVGMDPVSGITQYGVMMHTWEDFVPGKPGERELDEMKWGMPMVGNSTRIRLWAMVRWVPNIPGPAPDNMSDDDEAPQPQSSPVDVATEALQRRLSANGVGSPPAPVVKLPSARVALEDKP